MPGIGQSKVLLMAATRTGAGIAALALLVALSAHADIPFDGDVPMLSSCIGAPALTGALVLAETLAKGYQFDMAAEELAKALGNPAVAPCLDDEVEECGTVLLCLESVRLFYQMKATQNSTDSLAAQCRDKLLQYATNAAGRCWHAYGLLYAPIIVNAHRTKDSATLFEAYEGLVRYDPRITQNAVHYMCLIIEEGRVTSNSLAILDGPAMPTRWSNEGYQLMKCKVLRVAGVDAFSALLEWLRRYPRSDMNQLQQAFELGGKLVGDGPAARRSQYATALTNLALAQPPDRLDAIAYILAERGKWRQPAATAVAPPAS